ncbi:MAG: hypothetical protein LBH97_00965 [Treponema sp.]|jgi:hypothetical protein|nr:hypothetical protein [Treponema sp.]
MTRGILIAGNESALITALELETVKRVDQFARALIPNRVSEAGANPGFQSRRGQPSSESGGQVPVEQARHSLQWNPSSPISARTLVLGAENRLEHIDEAILVCDPPSIRRAVADLPLADIEVLINDQIKGWFFLVKELAAVFRVRKSGTLALVYNDIASGGGKDEAANLIGPSALASFSSLLRGLLASASSEPYFTVGFSNSGAGDEAGFAAFVLKALDEGSKRNNGKLHKYGKFNFFR